MGSEINLLAAPVLFLIVFLKVNRVREMYPWKRTSFGLVILRNCLNLDKYTHSLNLNLSTNHYDEGFYCRWLICGEVAIFSTCIITENKLNTVGQALLQTF